MTWHGTSDQAWDEILNIAGANNPLPKMVTELVATEDSLAFKCLQKKLPYLGICFSEYHRKLLRTRLAQRIFMSMMEDASPFGSLESRSTLQKIWANTDTADGDPDDSGDDEPKSKRKKVTKATGSAGSKVSLTRKKRQSAGKDKDKDKDKAGKDKDKAKPDVSKRQALLDKLIGDDGEEDGEEDQEEGEEEGEEDGF